MTGKRSVTLIVSLSILFSVIQALVFTQTVSADSFDGVVWKNVHTENFEGSHKWWGCFDDYNGLIYRISTPSGKTNNTGDSLGTQVLRIPQSTSAYRELLVVTDAQKTFYEGQGDDEVHGGNPYYMAGYTDDQLKMVRISLDIMKDATDRTTNVQLVGKKNGEIVRQSRTVGFNKDGKIYINGKSKEYGRQSLGPYTANKWYKIVMMINCETDTYKVGISSGSDLTWLDEDGLDEGMDFDCILGIDIIAKKEGTSTTKLALVDNIALDVMESKIVREPTMSVLPGSGDYSNHFKINAYMGERDPKVTDGTRLYMGLFDRRGILLDCDTLAYADDIETKYFQKTYNGQDSDHVKLFAWNGIEPIITVRESSVKTVFAEVMKSKNGADATVVFVHDDGDNMTVPFLNTAFSKYNLNGTVAIIGQRVDDTDEIDRWTGFLSDSNGRLNFACHTYYHEYMGATDDEERTYTWGDESYTYPAGYMTQTIANERARINNLFPGERMLAFVKPGSNPPDGETEQVSAAAKAMIREHYIAMRNTGGGVDTIPPADMYSVKSVMGRYTDDYTSGNYQSAVYWRSFIDQAISKKGLIVYLFHSIKGDSSANSLTTSQTRVSILLKALAEKVASGKIWSAKFDEAMQYAAEYGANPVATAVVYDDETPYISVGVKDNISKIDTDNVGQFKGLDMYDYPLTVKVAVPFNWTYVKLTQSYNNRVEIAKTFIDGGVRYVYANVVPDQPDAILTEAQSSDYVGTISVGGNQLTGFDPAKLFYNVELPYGTSSAPQVTATSGSVQQATLSSGEGSAFVTYGKLKYEVHFSVAKQGPSVLLRIDPSSDDGSYTTTKKIVSALKDYGLTAHITDQACATALSASYNNIVYCSEAASDNCNFEFDDTYESGKRVEYKQFAAAYTANSGKNRLIMTVHPAAKSKSSYDESLLNTFIDQIDYLIMQGVTFE